MLLKLIEREEQGQILRFKDQKLSVDDCEVDLKFFILKKIKLKFKWTFEKVKMEFWDVSQEISEKLIDFLQDDTVVNIQKKDFDVLLKRAVGSSYLLTA